MEVSGYLVGSAAFKAVGRGEPPPAGSIPVHLRHKSPVQSMFSFDEKAKKSHHGHRIAEILLAAVHFVVT
jgi:hypothetical protein